MKMKQLDVLDTFKPSLQKKKVPAKSCTLLKQGVGHPSLPVRGSTQIWFLCSRFTGMTSLERVPRSAAYFGCPLLQLVCSAGKKSISLSQIFCLMALLALPSEKHRVVLGWKRFNDPLVQTPSLTIPSLIPSLAVIRHFKRGSQGCVNLWVL